MIVFIEIIFLFLFWNLRKKNCFVVYDFFEYEDNFFVDRENYIFVGLLVGIFWFFCVVFDVVFFVMFFVYDV